MHDVDALKMFNPQLAMHYPTYAWSFANNDVCSGIFVQKGKNDGYLCQLRPKSL